MQIIGNLCASFAALIYFVPVQYLLFELARKRDDGGGAIASLIVIGAMWLLLLVGLLAATAQGGMDVLPMRRGLLYGLVVAASLALAVVTFVSLVSLSRPSWMERLTVGLPIYLIPPLTIAFIMLAVNPGLAPRIPLNALRATWMVIAGLSLAGCVAYLGTVLVRRVSGVIAQTVHNARQDPVILAKLIAEVPTLDPQLHFDSLIRHVAYSDSPELRRLANERLRTLPDLIARVIEALGKREPDLAIAFVAAADFSDEERSQLAQPLHEAMLNFADYIHSHHQYYSNDWRSKTRAWGRPIYRSMAAKFAGTGPDFASLPAAFDRAFVSE